MSQKKILIVDDEEHICELIGFNLRKNGYNTIVSGNGSNGLKLAREEKPDLILLDVMLPELDGYEVCKEIRKDSVISSTPIIMITARGEEFDKVLGLELGADDYITKPFSIRELVARVKAVLRRTEVKTIDKNYRFGNINIDFEKHEVTRNGNKIELTLKEFELLKILIENKGRVMTRDFLLDKVWGYEYVGETRTIDVHIRHLRQKIEEMDKKPKYIETIRGIGYRFNSEE
ncbi:response regulator transcription factor [Clostridium luticellarii]|uniref:Stage 0 sporulation protein A homolog n=1 Tax=Clostridium luticellarii TaxID=1691940 RepID=A0A2T0BRF1_9CLOT|nr:response regulator transcription factor [Clostridium luticellarii]MCI1943836.1 response regulator transcription factor [Clostridium luticellarii]MCI1967097.1 response regulator transcription factor [Clostridium luticellarii]MCI1994464.1 response regulator transcription factor [Clostridium luticellarii]MCI2038583.1 response regulator transcription factor [Clostridium luticellarii]PRR86457.1 Alkaline phosphatase synthesis transcriptional regulatory protein PhoP [Clostridium luticellarii]